MDEMSNNEMRDDYLKAFLANLERYNFDEYMSLCYNLMLQFPQDILKYDKQSVDVKINSLDRMINHFEGKEEYEKCQHIKKVQDVIKLYKTDGKEL